MAAAKLMCILIFVLLATPLLAQTDSSAKEFPFYFRSGFTEHFQVNIAKLADSIGRMKIRLQNLGGDDSTRYALTRGISIPYIEINNDSSLKYALEARRLAQLANNPAHEAQSNDFLGAVYIRLGNSSQALECLIKARNYYQAVNKNATQMIVIGRNMGDLYSKEGDTLLAKENYYNALSINPRTSADFQFRSWALIGLGEIFLNSGNLDSAMYYTRESISISDRADRTILRKYTSQAFHNYGLIMLKRGDTASAFEQMKRGLEAAYNHTNYQITGEIFMSIAGIYAAKNLPDSAFVFYKAAYEVANVMKMPDLLEKSSFRLKEHYKSKGRIDSAFYYAEKLAGASVSSRDIEKAKQTQTITFKETLKQQQSHAAAARSRARIIYFSLASILGIVMISGIVLYRMYQKQRHANTTLQKQKQEIQSTLELLRSTQTQLIQSEKMASLGELTAGIAHEIQNPLNFVNNFSEINSELIEELEQVLKSGDGKEAIAIAGDLKENEAKINYHGRRADSIVKGMLQHSRTSTGEKEPTNINALCDEYLRLAYHGLRSKDILFNALLETDFDPRIGKVNIISQDISRVLLNLFNNAFYAVNERKKISGKDYFPKVKVTTKKEKEQVVITVTDNGIGIPGKITDKIFQPFFTTKPTGQGTGLGLSLSYDIVKAHGGEFRVESEEGIGSVFTIFLPSEYNSQADG